MSQPDPLICARCQPCGPAILPVRYAAIPASLSPKLPGWAQPETAFPAMDGYDYGLRAMRSGFLYVYYEALYTWEAWSISPDGGLWKQNDALSAQPKYSSDCSRGFHHSANIEFIVLDTIVLTSNIWLAFSPNKWNPALFSLYGSDGATRQKRMQLVEPWRWVGSEDEHGIAEATEANLQTVLDYQPTGPTCPEGILPYALTPPRVSIVTDEYPYYSFASDAIRPRSTFYPWSSDRAGKSGLTMAGLKTRGTKPDGTPIKPLMMAVNDPIGIAHELTTWCNDISAVQKCYLDELSIEFSTYYNMTGLESLIRQAAAHNVDSITQFNRDRQILEATKLGEPAESAGKRYDAAMAQRRIDEQEHAWSRYHDRFDQSRIISFTETTQTFFSQIDEKLDSLIASRLLWLKHAQFLAAIDDFNSDKVNDNVAFRTAVTYAMASINLSEAGKAQIDAWIAEYSAEKKENLVWRNQFFNNPEVIASTTTLLEKMKDAHLPGWRDQISVGLVMNYSNAYADAIERAESAMSEALAKQKAGALLSSAERALLQADTWLTTATDRMLTNAITGTLIDSPRAFIFRIFAWLEAGGPRSVLLNGWGNSVLDPFGNKLFPSGSKKAIQHFMDDQKHIVDENLSKLERYRNECEKLVKSVEAESRRPFRIKATGVLLYSSMAAYMFWNSDNRLKDAPAIAVPALFAVSSLTGLIEENYKSVITGTDKALVWQRIGGCAGSVAAGLTVMLDIFDLINKGKKNDAFHLTAMLAGGKLVADTAFFINTTDVLLSAVEKTTIKKIIETKLGKTAGGRIVEFIGVAGTWEAMLIIAFAQTIYDLITPNDIQYWCSMSVLGLDSRIHRTYMLNEKMRDAVIEKQEGNLKEALISVFGEQETEEDKNAAEAERKRNEEYLHRRNAMRF